jgi:hypothetical protein
VKDFNAGIGAVALYLVALVGSYLLNGWTLTVLWGWFIRPTFGLPALGIAPAIGLSIIVGYLVHRSQSDKEWKQKTWTEKWIEPFVHAIIRPTFALAIGWVVHLFMGGS